MQDCFQVHSSNDHLKINVIKIWMHRRLSASSPRRAFGALMGYLGTTSPFCTSKTFLPETSQTSIADSVVAFEGELENPSSSFCNQAAQSCSRVC